MRRGCTAAAAATLSTDIAGNAMAAAVAAPAAAAAVAAAAPVATDAAAVAVAAAAAESSLILEHGVSLPTKNEDVKQRCFRLLLNLGLAVAPEDLQNTSLPNHQPKRSPCYCCCCCCCCCCSCGSCCCRCCCCCVDCFSISSLLLLLVQPLLATVSMLLNGCFSCR